MVDVPEARKFGFRLELHDTTMSEVLNSRSVRQAVTSATEDARQEIEAHVRATASPRDAENYAAALLLKDSYSDDYGFDFGGPWGLGNRPISVLEVPSGRGPDSTAKPPLMVEAETHALTSVPGFTVGATGEDIR